MKTKKIKKRLGMIGGLGPETSLEFYLKIIEKSRDGCNSYPSIIIDSVSIPFLLEKEIIQKSKNEEKILPILRESIKRLNRVGADFIVIPCNTIHIFIKELRRESPIPIVSIIDETIKRIKERGYRKVGLLATTKTIDSKLYENPMIKNGIDVILPSKEEQDEISNIIVEILSNNITDKSKKNMRIIVYKLIKRGSEAIILGCTDLQIILKQENFNVEFLDTMEILSESTFQRMVN